MDKSSKIFIVVMALLFVVVTAIVFFGGNSYELSGLIPNNNSKSVENGRPDNGSFQPYMNAMHDKITQKWVPPVVDKDTEVIVEYTIMKNGYVKDVKIAQSSGNAEVDNSALEALKNSSPLPPLPLSFDNESINVKFNFMVKAQK